MKKRVHKLKTFLNEKRNSIAWFKKILKKINGFLTIPKKIKEFYKNIKFNFNIFFMYRSNLTVQINLLNNFFLIKQPFKYQKSKFEIITSNILDTIHNNNVYFIFYVHMEWFYGIFLKFDFTFLYFILTSYDDAYDIGTII